MPRSERRRWWLERTGWGGWYIKRPADDETHPRDAHVALWRLVQWQRIRLNRALVECDIRAGMKRDDDAAYARVLLSADADVLDARCREEEMRVLADELEHKLWEFYGDGD